ncbi:MAG: hypothetical protein ACI4Q8_06435 [Ruminococcus sp.]
MNDLFTKIDELKTLLDRKDELKNATTENNKAIESLKAEVATIMIDEECPSISRNGFRYSLAQKVMYSKKSEDDLMEQGINFFDELRECGLGELIKETVNPRSLQSQLSEIVENEGTLPGNLQDCINVFEIMDIIKRKDKVISNGK